MRTSGPGDLFAINFLRTGPTFGSPQDDHRPTWALRQTIHASIPLDRPDLRTDLIQCGCHQLVHRLRVVPFHEVWRIPVPPKQLFQLLVTDAGKNCRPGDLVAVKVQDRQHRSVMDRVEKLVGVPARRQGTGLRLSISNHTGHDQVGIVKRCSKGVRQRIPQLAPFVDRTRRFGGHMTRNAAGKRELFEQPLHPRSVLCDMGIGFRVTPLQIGVGHQTRTTMPRTSDVQDIEVMCLDHTVQMDVDKIQSRSRSPVADKARLHMLQSQRLPQ